MVLFIPKQIKLDGLINVKPMIQHVKAQSAHKNTTKFKVNN